MAVHRLWIKTKKKRKGKKNMKKDNYKATDPMLEAIISKITDTKEKRDFLTIASAPGVREVCGYDPIDKAGYFIIDPEASLRPEYSREADRPRVAKMGAVGDVLFRPDIMLTFRDRKWWRHEGNGRTALFTSQGQALIMCKCKISTDYEFEAASAWRLNRGGTKFSNREVLWAQLQAKDSMALAIVDTVHSFGFNIITDHPGENRKHSDMQNITILERAYKAGVLSPFCSIMAEWALLDGSLIPTARNNAGKLQSLLVTFCIRNRGQVKDLIRVIRDNKIVPETIDAAARKFDASHRLTIRSLRLGLIHVIKKAKGGFTIPQ